MALIVVASFPVAVVVLGDNATTTLDVDISQDPYNIQGTIKRVQDLTVTGVVGLTATRTFSGSTVSLTFSAPFVGNAFVHFSALI